jgi:hypothetical protein
MGYTIAIACGLLLVGHPAAEGKAQLVSTAEIVKIDLEKMSLQVQELAATSRSAPNRGSRRRSGFRLPGVGSIPVWTKQAKQYKVFVSKDTVLKLADRNIDFTDLHVGNHIIVSGTPKGNDIEAVTITRDSH